MAINPHTKLRLTPEELQFLEELEEFRPPSVKRRGTAPAVHRMIELARGFDAYLAKPLREYLRAEEMTVEQFAEMAGLLPQTVYDIVSLRTRDPHRDTVAKIRRFIGD